MHHSQSRKINYNLLWQVPTEVFSIVAWECSVCTHVESVRHSLRLIMYYFFWSFLLLSSLIYTSVVLVAISWEGVVVFGGLMVFTIYCLTAVALCSSSCLLLSACVMCHGMCGIQKAIVARSPYIISGFRFTSEFTSLHNIILVLEAFSGVAVSGLSLCLS